MVSVQKAINEFVKRVNNLNDERITDILLESMEDISAELTVIVDNKDSINPIIEKTADIVADIAVEMGIGIEVLVTNIPQEGVQLHARRVYIESTAKAWCKYMFV